MTSIHEINHHYQYNIIHYNSLMYLIFNQCGIVGITVATEEERRFFSFHEWGILVYEPSTCHALHEIRSTDIIPGTQVQKIIYSSLFLTYPIFSSRIVFHAFLSLFKGICLWAEKCSLFLGTCHKRR